MEIPLFCRGSRAKMSGMVYMTQLFLTLKIIDAQKKGPWKRKLSSNVATLEYVKFSLSNFGLL